MKSKLFSILLGGLLSLFLAACGEINCPVQLCVGTEDYCYTETLAAGWNGWFSDFTPQTQMVEAFKAGVLGDYPMPQIIDTYRGSQNVEVDTYTVPSDFLRHDVKGLSSAIFPQQTCNALQARSPLYTAYYKIRQEITIDGEVYNWAELDTGEVNITSWADNDRAIDLYLYPKVPNDQEVKIEALTSVPFELPTVDLKCTINKNFEHEDWKSCFSTVDWVMRMASDGWFGRRIAIVTKQNSQLMPITSFSGSYVGPNISGEFLFGSGGVHTSEPGHGSISGSTQVIDAQSAELIIFSLDE